MVMVWSHLLGTQEPEGPALGGCDYLLSVAAFSLAALNSPVWERER
jgi:hypothetical protein